MDTCFQAAIITPAIGTLGLTDSIGKPRNALGIFKVGKNRHIQYRYPSPVLEFENETTYRTLIKAVKKYAPVGSTVLDIGCGRGEMMRALSQAGYLPCGCDMDDECVGMGASHGDSIKMNIEDLDLQRFSRKIDCIVMSHVLEHVSRPHELLLKIRSSFKGIVIIAVPNPYSTLYVANAVMRMPIKYVNHGHLYSWDWHHLKTFLELGCNLRILQFYSDAVALPLPSNIRSVLARLQLLNAVEYHVLKNIFPRFCRSIIAVVQVGQ